MAFDVGTLRAGIEVDYAGLSRGLNASERAFRGFTRRTNTHLNKTKASILGLKTAWGAFAGALAGFGLIRVGRALVNTASMFEGFRVQLETTMGSAEKAGKALEWIEDFAKTTPYELGEITQAFIRLKSYGLDPMDGTLRTVGDASGALGKSLSQTVEALADAMMGEGERLKEYMIKQRSAGDKLAYTWTDSMGKIRHVVVDKNQEVIAETLKAMWNEKYAGGMERQSKTWVGTVSNIKDSITVLMKEIMEQGGLEQLKGIAEDIRLTFERWEKDGSLKRFAEQAGGAITDLIELMREMGTLLQTITRGFLYLNEIGSRLPAIERGEINPFGESEYRKSWSTLWEDLQKITDEYGEDLVVKPKVRIEPKKPPKPEPAAVKPTAEWGYGPIPKDFGKKKSGQKTPEQEVQSMIAALREQANELGKTERHMYDMRLAALGATHEQRKLAQHLWGQIEAHEKRNDLMSEGLMLTRRLRTPQEEYNEAVQRANTLFTEGAIGIQIYHREVERARRQYEDTIGAMKDGADEVREFWTDTASAMRNTMADLFEGIINGELRDFVSNFKTAMDRIVSQFLAARAQMALLGPEFAKGGEAGGLVGSVAKFVTAYYGGGAGGTSVPGPSVGPGPYEFFGAARAEGGPVVRGSTYLVGEKGPELFVPKASGDIMNNEQLSKVFDSVQKHAEKQVFAPVSFQMNVTTQDAPSFAAPQNRALVERQMSQAMATARRRYA